MLNVLLVETDINNTLLENALKSDGCQTFKTQHSPLFLKLVKESKPDVVVFNLDTPTERLILDLHTLNQQHPLPVVMFASDGSCETIHKVTQAEVSAFIVDGLNNHRIQSIIHVAIARFKYHQSTKIALEEARSQLEDRKQIDRAKSILIKTQNFTEPEAYHTLRRLSMNRNITLAEMAKNVIAIAELLK